MERTIRIVRESFGQNILSQVGPNRIYVVGMELFVLWIMVWGFLIRLIFLLHLVISKLAFGVDWMAIGLTAPYSPLKERYVTGGGFAEIVCNARNCGCRFCSRALRCICNVINNATLVLASSASSQTLGATSGHSQCSKLNR